VWKKGATRLQMRITSEVAISPNIPFKERMMSGNIAIYIFDDEKSAKSMLKSVKDMEQRNKLRIAAHALVVKDEKGKVKVKEAGDISTKGGAARGGVIGVIAGTILGGPIGGLVAGAVLGALTAKAVDFGISDDQIKLVSEEMDKGKTALFLELASGELGVISSSVRQMGGQVIEVDVPEATRLQAEEVLASSSAMEGRDI
jgi:uncharacterized membrane protein